MQTTSLTSLAILKVNWDKGQDYIQNFVPFVAEATSRAAQDEVSVVEVQRIIREDFGLVIPQGALSTLLRRAERAGLLRRERGVYVRVAEAIDPSFERVRADVARQHEALIDKFIAFCEEKHKVTLTRENADSALLGHLQNSCIPLLAAAVDGCAIPPPAQTVQHADYLVSAFTIDLYQRDPVGFGFLETVMKGSMVANALFLPEIAQTKRKFDKLCVYLDTPLLLRAMGLNGATPETATKELLTLLYGLNVDLACFEATRDELRGVLEAAQHALRDPRNDSRHPFAVFDYLLSVGASASDVELIIANLDRSLRKLRIAVRPTPPHVAHLGLDEMRLAHLMRKEMPMQRDEAHLHDLNSLTSIHRLRNGAPKYNVETCGFVFVTTNNGLAMASAGFAREQFGHNTVPQGINDHTMATLAWIKNPTLVESFSRHRLIAESYAAMRPNAELWRKYLEEITKLKERGDISDTDADLLRLSTSAKNTLVELTLGSAETFTEGTVQEVLEAAKAEVRKSTEITLAEERQKRVAAENQAAETSEAFAKAHASQAERVQDVAATIGKVVSRTGFLIVTVVAVLGSIMALPFHYPDVLSEWLKFLVAIAIIVSFGFGAWNLVNGGNIRQWARWVEIRVARSAESFMKWLVGFPSQ